jgi:rSAM/selenodomain-associated transferase 2
MKISIIIPAYNEENTILDLLHHLKCHANDKVLEILVVDGQSTDKTPDKVIEAGFQCIRSKRKGRAAQMNTGAKQAAGSILYFVHADTFPPKTYANDILKAVRDGYESGCYRFCFDSDKWPLKINSWFTRFDFLMCRGGDQSLFIKRSVFEKLGGFKNYDIMEDFEMIQRLRQRNGFRILPKNVVVSSRKYEKNSYFKVNFINLVIFVMFSFGASQRTMLHTYRQLITGTRFGHL